MNDGEALQTRRLVLRRLEEADVPFILALLNDPDWLRYIGDRGAGDTAGARAYIRQGPQAMYEQYGHGLYRVALKESDTPIGLCGLLRRPQLADADLGFAFLPAWRGGGYAREAAVAVLAEARDVFGLQRVLAIVTPDNRPSIRLLERLGFVPVDTVQLEDDPQLLKLYVREEEAPQGSMA